MSNIIDAIINIVNNPVIKVVDYSKSHSRANNMGDALEEYIKDIFANISENDSPEKRNKKLSNCFSYLGNQNNPPDAMLDNGDAIEIKKLEINNSKTAPFLSLNSSYPKAKLYRNSKMITENCKSCDNWDNKDQRDIIYVVGAFNGKNKTLSSLSMVYGLDYAAAQETYERISDKVKAGINSIPNLEFSETNELGRVNCVDPLGITYFRMRGMWGIKNPIKVFDYVYQPNLSAKFNLMVLIDNDKYSTFTNTGTLENLKKDNNNLIITNVAIKNPNNPAKLKNAKLITFFLA